MKKITLLFALLCASVMGWASTELFDAANATIDHTYFRTYGWAVETTPSTCTWSAAELAISMTEGKNEQWQAQVFLDTKITFDASKKYTVSFDIITTNGVGGVMVKLGNTGTMYDETITTGASVAQHYTKENVQGVAGNDGMLIFDFGYAPANTDVTITNISILEQDAPSAPETYCQKATGHLGNPAFGDANGRILLTITKLSDSSVGVKVEPNNGGADVFDFVEVILGGVSKTLGSIGGSVPTTSEITYEGLASLNFNVNVLWHHKTWADAAGRWTTQTFAVSEAELCPAPIASEYCGYEGAELQQDGHYVKMTIETQPNGNVTFLLASGTNSGACTYRNGGFEGGIGAFIVSTDDFASSEPASTYFTATQVYSGNTYTLTKTADLPANAKIKHVGSVHALAWRDGSTDRYCFPDIVYTYGSVCAETPELTSIVLSASSTFAQVGEEVTLTASPLDQFGAPIEATINYAISPADAGSVSGNVFTFAKTCVATITASSGLVAESVTLYGVSSTNIALNKTCESGFYDGNTAESADKANDGSDGDDYHGWVTWGASSAAVEWWYVDLGKVYDITAISVLWGSDYSTNYLLQARNDAPANDDEKADDDAWTDITSVTSASANSVAMNYVSATGRYVRFHSLSKSGACIRLRELRIFGSEAASLTKEVSATPSDPTMGTATVKQLGVDVTEVATGSEVTFSAVANDGYIFVEWSNGEKNATFNATVNSAMNLTANFRALGNIYCNTAVTSTRDDDVHIAYATLKRTSANDYALIVRSAETLGNFTNTELVINGTVTNLNNHGTLSNENHVLTYEFTSTTAPSMNTPYLYVNVPGSKFTECWFTKLTNIEYDVPCDDDVATTAVALSQTSANLLMGATMTFTPSYTPAYTSDKALTWTTSNPAIATVDGGVVTPVAPGTVTITAKLTSDNSISATCEVTVVDALLPATWYGYSVIKPQEGVTGYTYTITRNADQTLTFTMTTDKNIVGYVSGIAGDVTGSFAGYTSGTHSGSFTTTATYTDNTLLNLRLTFASALYAAPDLHIAYYVGSSNTALPQAVAVNETKDNEAILDAYDGQNVIGIVGRSFTAGSLYTLVMPFDVDAAQTAAKLPGSLTTLNNTIVKENGDLRVNFVNASTIEAGVPYLYVPSVNVENPVFEGVSLDKDLQPTEPADGYAKYYGIYAPTTGSVLKTIANAYVLGSDQYLYDVQDLLDEQSMKALRGYFVLNFPSTSSNPAPKPRAKIVFNSNETQTTTGIGEVDEENVQCTKFMENGILYIVRDGKMYNAQGQLMK